MGPQIIQEPGVPDFPESPLTNGVTVGKLFNISGHLRLQQLIEGTGKCFTVSNFRKIIALECILMNFKPCR